MITSVTYDASTRPGDRLPRTVTISDQIDDYPIKEYLREHIVPLLIGIGYHKDLINEHVVGVEE